MRITESNLRSIIRQLLIAEQVLGYEPPSEKNDDEGEYVDAGDMGVDTTKGSEESTAASAQSVQSLTQQRQEDLDKGDAVAANEDALELNTATKERE